MSYCSCCRPANQLPCEKKKKLVPSTEVVHQPAHSGSLLLVISSKDFTTNINIGYYINLICELHSLSKK